MIVNAPVIVDVHVNGTATVIVDVDVDVIVDVIVDVDVWLATVELGRIDRMALQTRAPIA